VSARSQAAEWTRRAERGSLPLIRFMVRASLVLGRTGSRVLLRLIAAYFLAFGGAAGRASRRFLARALGRMPSLAERYRLVFTFATVLHDRIYFLRNRFDLFEIEVRGAEHFRDGEGVLLMGAHMGSFEALRACGREMGRRRVVMAMYEDNARRMNAMYRAVDPDALQDVVALSRPQSMIEIARRLEEGALVGMLADRTLGTEPALALPFLGVPAHFPTGPMRIAAALGRRVIFMVALHRGGNRYEIAFEPLADFSGDGGNSREHRDALVSRAVTAYAARLERCAREAPYNWFNFHDFWDQAR
jgi:predicted LPLAT superfamily acyltransferase